MTCIAGLVAPNGVVWMAGDSLGSSGWDGRVRNDGKVFKVGRMVVGFAWSYRMGQILRYHVVVPEHPKGMDAHEWMVTKFVPTVRRAFTEHGFHKVENGREEGGKFLVGYQGRLFCVESDHQVGEHSHGFDAVGCGEPYALGALANVSGSPRKRVVRAVETAALFSNGVGGRIDVMSGGAPWPAR